MTNWNLQTASGKGQTWAEATSTWALTTQTWAGLGAAAWSDATKNVASFTNQEISDIDARLLIDSTYHLLIDGTYKLLVQAQSPLTQWTDQGKN